MKIVRAKYNDAIFYGQLNNDSIYCLDASLGISQPIAMREAEILPLTTPSKIVCVGLNYREHAKELNMPLPDEPAFFLKPSTSLISPNEPILLPENIGKISYEGELAFIIKQPCSNISVDEAKDYILGYTVANDVTARDIQKKEILTGRSKCYDSFCPLAFVLETNLPAPESVLRTWVNGELKQECAISDMIFSPYEILASLSQVMTFLPGDVVLTGTPQNVGAINHNDRVKIALDNVAEMENIAVAKRKA